MSTTLKTVTAGAAFAQAMPRYPHIAVMRSDQTCGSRERLLVAIREAIGRAYPDPAAADALFEEFRHAVDAAEDDHQYIYGAYYCVLDVSAEWFHWDFC